MLAPRPILAAATCAAALFAAALFAAFALAACAAKGVPMGAAPGDVPDFDAWWDYDDPGGTRARFAALLPQLPAGAIDAQLQLRTQIARTLGLQGRFDEAHAVLDAVEPRLAPGLEVARVRYLLERGRAWRSAGERDKALPLFAQAFDLGRSAGAAYHAIDAAHMVAITVDDAAARRDWSRRGIELAQASAEPQARHWLGSIYNNMAWDLHDAGQYTAALELFEQALAARLEEGEPGSIGRARWGVARCLRSLGRLDEALAVQLGLGAAHETAGTRDGLVAEELGELYLAKGEPGQAAAHFAEALRQLSHDPWLVEHEAARLARIRALAGDPPPEEEGQ